MTAFSDDDLQAMLRARADRVSPSAASQTLEAARSEIRGSRRGASFSVLPIMTGRSSGISAGWAAAAVMAVLLLVVVATRPQGVPPAASAPGGIGGSPAVGAPSASALGSPSTGPHLTVAELRAAVTSGSADGQLFVVQTTLEDAASPACAQEPCTRQYELALVGDVVTEEREGLPVKPARPADGSTPLDGTYAVTPWKGSLVLIGRVDGSVDQPTDPDSLRPTLFTTGPGAIAIAPVTGPVVSRYTCLVGAASSCETRQFLLSSAAPIESSLAVSVWAPAELASPVLGTDGNSASQTDGPFLVRTGVGDTLEIVARYDPAAVRVVDAPIATCDVPAGSPLPTCGSLMRIALGATPDAGEVYSVDVHQGVWTCPAGVTCHSVPGSQSAYVVVASTSGEWTVGLTFDASGSGLDAVPMPDVTTVTPAPLPGVPTTCSELGYGQSSTLSCGSAVAAALKVVPAGTPVVSVEFGYGIPCPPYQHCILIPSPDPNAGHVTVRVRSPGPDLWVAVKADAGGNVTASPPVAYPSEPSASTAP